MLKTESFPYEIINKMKLPGLVLLFISVLGALSRKIRQEIDIIRKEEVKLSLVTDDLTLYIDNPKEFLKN